MSLVAELERLRMMWNDAWLHKDVATVDQMMAEDYIYIAPNGQLADRYTVLALVREPSYRLDEATRSEAAVSIIGPDAAAVVHRFTGRGTYQGTPFAHDHRCTMVCVVRHDSWQILLEHCSNLIESGRPRATMALPAYK